jgi:hypothetical protein
MAACLDLAPDEFARQAGLRPLLEVGTDGQVRGAEALSEDERQEVQRVLRAALNSLERDGQS